MFNPVNCNGPPLQGDLFFIRSSLYRVDLFLLSDQEIPGFPGWGMMVHRSEFRFNPQIPGWFRGFPSLTTIHNPLSKFSEYKFFSFNYFKYNGNRRSLLMCYIFFEHVQTFFEFKALSADELSPSWFDSSNSIAHNDQNPPIQGTIK